MYMINVISVGNICGGLALKSPAPTILRPERMSSVDQGRGNAPVLAQGQSRDDMIIDIMIRACFNAPSNTLELAEFLRKMRFERDFAALQTDSFAQQCREEEEETPRQVLCRKRSFMSKRPRNNALEPGHATGSGVASPPHDFDDDRCTVVGENVCMVSVVC